MILDIVISGLISGSVYALEVNTIPGFTKHSLLPKAAERQGISMTQLCKKIVEIAMNDAVDLSTSL